MKRLLIAAMVAVLAVSAFLLAGCGGDTETAKKYMKEADTSYEALSKQLSQLSSSTTALVSAALQGNLSAITPEDLTKIVGMVGTFEPEIAKVKDEYAKITPLNGVEDYVAYANAMIKALDADAAIVAAGGAFLAELEPYLRSGDVVGLQKKIEQSTAQIAKMQAMQTTTDKAYADAQQIKKDKNLGQ